MNNARNFNLLLATAALTGSMSASATLITFDENVLAPGAYYNPQANTSFASGGTSFDHGWNSTFNCCWSNFSYSNSTDTTTAGYLNDRSAITGDGAGTGQDIYGISFDAGAYINFGKQTLVNNMEITNTTYAYLSMLNGDSFAKQFTDGDFFRLTINGLNENGDIQNSTEVSLAEGRNIVNQWLSVDLSSLNKVYGLSFDYSSSDMGIFGINTPQYFAVDNINIQAVPEPSAILLLGAGLGILMRLRKNQT